MRFVYLEGALPGLLWFRRYYQSVFPEGGRNGRAQFTAMKATLIANPKAGHPVGRNGQARMFVIPRTPFSVIYRVRDDRIEVLAIHDHRSGPTNPVPPEP